MLQLTTLTHRDLAERAQHWNDLWARSESRVPCARAEAIELWHRSFSPESELQAVGVTRGQQLVGAIPLIRDKTGRALTMFRLPINCTVSSGDLLIDADAGAAEVTRLLAKGIMQLPGSFVSLDNIEIAAGRWQHLIHHLRREGREIHIGRPRDVGVVDILHDWDAYIASWSRNHRSAVKRTRKKFESEGKVEVVRLRDPSDGELYEVMERCMAIEDLGWKGAEGTSILRSPGLRDYYHREARVMRDYGMMDLWLLKLDGRIIAFEYCHFAKGVCLSHKISFDPAWERFSPGRLLRYYQLEQYHQDASASELDTLGILCEAKAKWATRTYGVTRCVVAIGGPSSNVLLRGMKAYRKCMKRIRGEQQTTQIKPGAARYLETANPVSNVPSTINPVAPIDITVPTWASVES